MPVRPPRPAEINRLLTDLSNLDAVTRESASARLQVLGPRIVPALRTLLADDDAAQDSRILALRTLSAVDAAAAVAAAAAAATQQNEALALESITLLSTALTGDDGSRESLSETALEALTGVALSADAPQRRRLKALDALSALPGPLRKPLFASLEADLDPVIAQRVGAHGRSESVLEGWLRDRDLPSDPNLVGSLLDTEGDRIALTDLRRLIELLRAREKDLPPSGRQVWRTVRGRVHVVLAGRRSSVAVYDIRETLEQTALAVDASFLTAARAVADASCLEAVATRWAESSSDGWLRDQFAQVFQAIAERSGLKRNSATMARILRRWPDAGALMPTAPRPKGSTRRTPPARPRQ